MKTKSTEQIIETTKALITHYYPNFYFDILSGTRGSKFSNRFIQINSLTVNIGDKSQLNYHNRILSFNRRHNDNLVIINIYKDFKKELIIDGVIQTRYVTVSLPVYIELITFMEDIFGYELIDFR